MRTHGYRNATHTRTHSPYRMMRALCWSYAFCLRQRSQIRHTAFVLTTKINKAPINTDTTINCSNPRKNIQLNPYKCSIVIAKYTVMKLHQATHDTNMKNGPLKRNMLQGSNTTPSHTWYKDQERTPENKHCHKTAPGFRYCLNYTLSTISDIYQERCSTVDSANPGINLNPGFIIPLF